MDFVLDSFRRQLEGEGVRTTVLGARGDPAEGILDAAHRLQADLVAMTTHGRSGLSHYVFGSVTEQVLRRCLHPMLVLRTVPLPRVAPRRHRAGAPAPGGSPSSGFLTSFR
jgi:nucleotide-binding universal stress UspA family protein